VLPGGLLNGLGLPPVRFYELIPYVSEVRVVGARRGKFLLWSRGVWFFLWRGEAGGMIFAYRFFISIASAAWVFCTFKHNNDLITKKKKEKEKKQRRDRIFRQPSKYFSILKVLQYDYALLSLHTLLLYEPLRSKEPGDYCDTLNGPPEHRTIAIVLSNTTIHPSYYLKREYLSQTTQDKQASSVLSKEDSTSLPVVQENETRIHRRWLSLPVAHTLNNRIVTRSLNLSHPY